MLDCQACIFFSKGQVPSLKEEQHTYHIVIESNSLNIIKMIATPLLKMQRQRQSPPISGRPDVAISPRIFVNLLPGMLPVCCLIKRLQSLLKLLVMLSAQLLCLVFEDTRNIPASPVHDIAMGDNTPAFRLLFNELLIKDFCRLNQTIHQTLDLAQFRLVRLCHSLEGNLIVMYRWLDVLQPPRGNLSLVQTLHDLNKHIRREAFLAQAIAERADTILTTTGRE
mmetsp:Transcript_26949/g.45915  ORF Transcript_26949/g.45915 Transcript_26949/m.45915 type:complete len:224 (+) Transcript_26949:148-819(+)